MKKAFSVFLSFCLCTITMLGFTACGDDEHEHEDKHEHGRRTDLVDEFGRIRWDDRVNLWAIVCSKPIDFVGNYYVEDMPKLISKRDWRFGSVERHTPWKTGRSLRLY